MKKIHPYHHMRPRRVDISTRKNLSYSISRHAEDQDIRFGFGRCGRADNENVQLVEVDLAWLGVVFHLVMTSDEEGSAFKAISVAKDDIEAVKQITRNVIVHHLVVNPERLQHILETIHEGSREQGQLESAKTIMAAMNVKLENL